MTFPRSVIFGTILLLLALLSVDYVKAARGRGGGSHSYPSSKGYSGHSGGSHSYPSSNSGGLSGNSRGGGGHVYPSSGGLSGNTHGGGSHGYPSSSGGLSGNSYPASKGMSGNTHTTHTTVNNYNYHYSPPQQIRYTPAHGPPMTYPVYQHQPPAYVYQYKDSGSKYGTLLAGLALLNLGTLAGSAYAISHSGSGSSGSYKAQPGEICKFGIRKDNGDYEETKIDCQLISSFILQAEQEKLQNGGTNRTIVTTTVTNVTMVNTTNGGVETTPAPGVGNVIFSMMPNGTLVPLNGTFAVTNNTATGSGTQPTNASTATSVVVTTTITNSTVTDAINVKGKPIDVTPGMQCYVIRLSHSLNIKKTVPCGVLQMYAEKSLKKNSASRNVPIVTALSVILAMLLVY